MSKPRFFVPMIIVILIILLSALVAVAQNYDPSVCFPGCYASNIAMPDSGDGTSISPWVVASDQESSELRRIMSQTAQDEGIEGYLTMTTCNTTGATCSVVRYRYDVNGRETAQSQPGQPPVSGVDLPFIYILMVMATLGILIIGGGVIFWRRAMRTT